MSARGGYSLVPRDEHPQDAHADQVEKGFVKPNGSYSERRFAWLARAFIWTLIGVLVAIALLKTVVQRGGAGETTPNIGIVEGNWITGVEGGTSGDFGRVDEKARHRFPTIATEAGITISEAATSNEELFSSKKQEKRFQTYLLLDKPVYRPGEFVRGSCFVMNALDNTLVSAERGLLQQSAQAIIKDPKGVQLESFYAGEMENSVWAFQWQIPPNVAGGDFTMEIKPMGYASDSALTPVERKFEVRATRASNAKINKKLQFAKDSYSAGDSLQVSLLVDGDDVTTTAQFTATVDSSVVSESEWIPVTDGQATYKFDLPSRIARGEGVVVARVKRGPILETSTKTIPIVSQMLDLGVFPEGGVLVNGIKQRVYIEALDGVSGKPADFSGFIFSNLDPAKPIAFFESVHEGRGISDYFVVPKDASRVYLSLQKPSSVKGQKKDIPLRGKTASLQGDSVALSTPNAVFQTLLQVDITATESASYKIGVFKKEQKLREQLFTAKANSKQTVSFDLAENHDHYGVLRVTLLNGDGLPVAERLVFRMPLQALEIELASVVAEDITSLEETAVFQAHKLTSSPADGIAVNVRTWMRNVDGKTGEFTAGRTPVQAVVALRVTDSGLAATVEKRLLPPRLPAAVFLETEVDRLHDADAFFPRTQWGWHQNAKDATTEGGKRKNTWAERLDLLLGTQGWRTFAYYDASGFLSKGIAPVLPDRFVPVGVKFNRHNSVETVPSSPSSSLSVPVSKTAIERMLGLPGKQQMVMYTMAAGADFAKRNRGPPQMMMAQAPQMQMDDMMKMEAAPVVAMAMPEDAAEEEFTHEEDAADDEVNEEEMPAPIAPPAAEEADEQLEDAHEQLQDADEQLEDYRGDLRAQRVAGKFAQGAAMWRKIPPPVMVSRVYAHPQRKYLKKEFESGPKRSDFTETVYFNPSVLTVCSETVCEARVSFGLSEASSATFVVHSDGISSAKSKTVVLGASHMFIETSVPLEVDFSLPSIVVNGDRPSVPITLQTSKKQSVDLKASFVPQLVLKPKTTKMFTVEKTSAEGSRIYLDLISAASAAIRGAHLVNLTVSAVADDGTKDAVTRSTVLMPKGFPAAQFKGGSLKTELSEFELKLPSDYVSGTLQVAVRAYTSPVGRLTKALEELIREPCGCFEQTSSTTYPLVFVLQYLRTHSGSDPVLVARAMDMLKRGYDKLVSFESPGGGFEWFGGAPGHEALTAYGLLQFAAMAHPTVGLKVDAKMVERTKQWMDSRRDGNGGFLRNSRALDSFGAAPELTTNAYITWALTRAGLLKSRKKDPEVEALVKRALESSGSLYHCSCRTLVV